MPQALEPSEEVVGERDEPRGHDGTLQPSLSYRTFNIDLDSLLPYEEFFDSTFSYDWSDSVPDHQPPQVNSENQSWPTCPSIPSNDQARGGTPLDRSLSPTRSVRQRSGQRSKSESASINQSEFLHFTTLSHRKLVVDCNWEPVPISVAAELQGNFFVPTPEPNCSAELTFSRRNVFRVAGSISKLPKSCYVIDDNGSRTAILNADVCVSGTDSKEGKQIDIIHVPCKTTAPTTSPVMDEPSSPGPRPIRLELEADTQISSGKTSLPLLWKRLQFKNSTANNGRRNGVQQKYRLKLTLTANLATGEKVPIVEAESGAIIVRGRSAWTSAKGEEADPSIRQKHPSSQVVAINAHHTGHWISRTANTPVGPSDQTVTSSPVGSLPTEKPLSPLVMLDLDSGFEHSTIMSEETHSLHRRPERTASMTKVVDHRAAEQYLTNDALHVGRAKDKSNTAKPPPLNYLNADPLYEYFPLGIEGWMPPVDAVYRPHVAHNTSWAPDLQF